jgi:hypothetical protein
MTSGEETLVPQIYVHRYGGLLDKISDDEWHWHCDQCRITTIRSVEDVRTAQDIVIPEESNEETFVSCPDYILDISIHKQTVYYGSFKELQSEFTSLHMKSEEETAGLSQKRRKTINEDHTKRYYNGWSMVTAIT